jgi:2-aminoethylphosphonate-pyruvate transaminase
MFRFTPATHLLLGMAEALREHAEEGGIEARQARFRASWRRLVDGMRQMGFRTLLEDEVASPIVATFHDPPDPNYSFRKLYDGMKARGFIIFPGRLAAANTFRLACIGIVTERDIGRALDAMAETLREMGVTTMGRAD